MFSVSNKSPSKAITVDVDAVADGATVTLTDASGYEDTVIPLDIAVYAPAASQRVSISFAGCRVGAQSMYVDGDGLQQSRDTTYREGGA